MLGIDEAGRPNELADDGTEAGSPQSERRGLTRERAESVGKKDTLDPCARRVGVLTESKHRTASAPAAAAAAC